MLKVISIQVADSIDIKSFKAFFTAEIYRSDADELFYRIGQEKYLCLPCVSTFTKSASRNFAKWLLAAVGETFATTANSLAV